MRGIIAVETPMSLVKIRRRFPRTREIFTIDAESYRRRCSVLRAAKNCDLRGTANASRRNYSREREKERDTRDYFFNKSEKPRRDTFSWQDRDFYAGRREKTKCFILPTFRLTLGKKQLSIELRVKRTKRLKSKKKSNFRNFLTSTSTFGITCYEKKILKYKA
jgi:hypothetical protein